MLKILFSVVFLVVLSISVLASPVILGEPSNTFTVTTLDFRNVSADYFFGSGEFLTGLNISNVNDVWVNITGDVMQGDIDMAGYQLTSVGALTVAGLTTAEDIIPDTDSLYTLGNSSNWWATAYIDDLYSNNIFTTNINASVMNSSSIGTEDIDTSTMDVSSNITLGGNAIKLEGGDLVVMID